MTVEGLVVCASHRDPRQTMDALVAAVERRGMSVMARIDHAAAAAQVGMQLRPTDVLVFGNPTAGTPLMDAVPSIGIDLPLKALVWQDEEGRTFLSYNDPAYLARRHGLGDQAKAGIDAMTGALKAIAAKATTATA